MSAMTKEEKAWVKKLQKVLNECPSSRLGFYTTGDATVTVYDREVYDGMGISGEDIDPAPAIEAAGLNLAYLEFPQQVEGLCG